MVKNFNKTSVRKKVDTNNFDEIMTQKSNHVIKCMKNYPNT